MKKKIALLAVVFLSILSLRCPKQDIEADKGAIQSLIQSDTIWFGASTKVDSTSRVSIFGPETTIVWWRGAQTHNQPTIQIEVVGDSAWVSWSRANFGNLYTLAKWDTNTTWVLWTKKVAETAQIRATFLRTGDTGDDNRGWQLHTISLAYGKSDSVNTVRIDSLRIKSSRYPDLVIRDPLNSYYRIDSLLAFKPGEPVTLTLYTNVIGGHAFLHTFIFVFPWYIRVNFIDKGNGV
ncbi:MAG: hypothetical protein ABIL05_05180, partial [candidate division WOR-3 bacterium]